eukprot:gene5459-7557_t
MFNFIFEGKIGEMLAPVVPTSQLFLSIQHHKNDDVQMLIATNAQELTKFSESGYTAIHVACRYNNRLALEIILNNGISVDFVDQSGNTPLHFASKYGHIDLCRFLIDRGCNAAKLNSRKQSAYDIAESHVVRQYLLPIILQADRPTDAQFSNQQNGVAQNSLPLLQSFSINNSPPPIPVYNTQPIQPISLSTSGVVPSYSQPITTNRSINNGNTTNLPPQRIIKPDGFHSSASDPKLQEYYGHTKEIINIAPPPIMPNGGIPANPPQYGLYGSSNTSTTPAPPSIYNRYVPYDAHNNIAAPPPQLYASTSTGYNVGVSNPSSIPFPQVNGRTQPPPISNGSSEGSVKINQNRLLGNMNVPNFIHEGESSSPNFNQFSVTPPNTNNHATNSPQPPMNIFNPATDCEVITASSNSSAVL